MKRRALHLLVAFTGLLTLIAGLAVTTVPAGAASSDTSILVSVGSAASPFAQNKQNEPAVTIDANHESVLAAGANDEIDMEACNAGDDTTCPFTPGVGSSGIYFSFDGGHTWTQPTYTGYSARNCLGVVGPDDGCTPEQQGPIGTLPWYSENGLVSDGDPALAFGPAPAEDGSFSWDNGSRLYYANLTSGFPGNNGLKGFEGIAVSRTDDAAAAASGDKNAWMPPVVASRQASATFSDKEQIWVDDASSSPFFGNTYICFGRFQGNGAEPMMILTSTDGGDTWSTKQVSRAAAVPPRHWGQSGCSIRTESDGTVHVFWEEFQSPFTFMPPVGTIYMITSRDGGGRWSRPKALMRVTDSCASQQFDGSTFRCVSDGIAGARADLAAAPSVSIANGAPTGADATNELVLSWADARDGTNHEHVMVSYSTNGGRHWSSPTSVEEPGDRGYYAAPALSPDGTDLYVVYNAFTTPFRTDTTSPRGLVGVVLHANVGADGVPDGWAELNRGAVGDPRSSTQNNLVMEFLGDYVYAAATNDYAAAVWNDTRDGADCPAVDSWRAAMQADPSAYPSGRPAVQQECPANFGNSDIYGGAWADPTP